MIHEQDKPFTGEGAVMLINRKQLAKMLSVSERTILRWDESNRLPPRVQIGRQVRYRLKDVIEWIEKDCPPGDQVRRGK